MCVLTFVLCRHVHALCEAERDFTTPSLPARLAEVVFLCFLTTTHQGQRVCMHWQERWPTSRA